MTPVEMAFVFGICLILSLVCAFIVGRSAHIFMLSLSVSLAMTVWAGALPTEILVVSVVLLFGIFLMRGDSY